MSPMRPSNAIQHSYSLLYSDALDCSQVAVESMTIAKSEREPHDRTSPQPFAGTHQTSSLMPDFPLRSSIANVASLKISSLITGCSKSAAGLNYHDKVFFTLIMLRRGLRAETIS